jgi:hypothetical protein
MMCRRLSPLLRHRRDGFAFIPALAAVAVLAAPATPALAASPLTGETLGGTATTTSGGGVAWPSCVRRSMAGASATFNASGEATGPYPGSSAENQGSANLFDTIIHNQLSYDNLSVPFAITSGTAPDTTTITGTISHSQSSLYPDFTAGFGLVCNGSAVAGLSVNTTATYTATIQAPGQASQTISGEVQVFGSVSAKSGVQTSLTANFTG